MLLFYRWHSILVEFIDTLRRSSFSFLTLTAAETTVDLATNGATAEKFKFSVSFTSVYFDCSHFSSLFLSFPSFSPLALIASKSRSFIQRKVYQ